MSREALYEYFFRRDAVLMKKGGKSGIHINPKNEGKFTESARRAGMGVQEYAAHVLAHKEDYDAITIRRANFARNAKKFKHEDGGTILSFQTGGASIPSFRVYQPSDKYYPQSMYISANPAEDTFDYIYESYKKDYPSVNKRIKANFTLDNDNRIDFYNYASHSKRSFIPENMNKIQDMLIEAGIPSAQRAALLSSILQESGGDPSKKSEENKYAKAGTYVGLLQFSHGDKGRLPDNLIGDLEGQVKKIISEIKANNHDAWNRGSAIDKADISMAPKVLNADHGREMFMLRDDPRLSAYYLNRCYVRPYLTSDWRRRADEAEYMYSLLNPEPVPEEPEEEEEEEEIEEKEKPMDFSVSSEYYTAPPIPEPHYSPELQKRGGLLRKAVRKAELGVDTDEIVPDEEPLPPVVYAHQGPIDFSLLSDEEFDKYMYENNPGYISNYAEVVAEPNGINYENELYNMSKADKKNFRKTGEFTFSNGEKMQASSGMGARNLAKNIGKFQRRESNYVSNFDPDKNNRFNTRGLSQTAQRLHQQNNMDLYAKAGMSRLADDDATAAYWEKAGLSGMTVGPELYENMGGNPQPNPQVTAAASSQMSAQQVEQQTAAGPFSEPLKKREDFASDEEYMAYMQGIYQTMVSMMQQFTQQASQAQQGPATSDNSTSQSPETYTSTYRQ